MSEQQIPASRPRRIHRDDPPLPLQARLAWLKPAASLGKISVAAGVAIALLVADQTVKSLIASNYAPHQTIYSTPYLSLVFVPNWGGVCGYGQGAGGLLTAIGAVTTIIMVLSVFFAMPNTWPFAAAFGMLLAGAAGNLIDRLRFGYVVDYVTLHLLRWPSFNVADASIVGGIALIGLLSVWETRGEDDVDEEAEPTSLGRSALLFFTVAGLVYAVSYVFCVMRPFD